MSFKARDGSIVPDVQTWRKWLLDNYAAQFSDIFHLPLRNYLSVARGFNANEFLWKIGAAPETGKSWRDVMPEKFGPQAIPLYEFVTAQPQRIPAGALATTKRGMHYTELPPAQVPQRTALVTAVILDESRGPSTQQPAEILGVPLTRLGAMFADEPEETEAQTEEEETPPNSLRSLFM